MRDERKRFNQPCFSGAGAGWFGMGWTVDNVREIRSFLEQLVDLIGNAKARDDALKGDDPAVTYMALWRRLLKTWNWLSAPPNTC